MVHIEVPATHRNFKVAWRQNALSRLGFNAQRPERTKANTAGPDREFSLSVFGFGTSASTKIVSAHN